MFHVIQSNDTDTLVGYIIDFYKNNSKDKPLGRMIFEPFTVIVPSMVLGDWLTKQVALKIGVSTLFTAEFWGKYQWQMTQAVLDEDANAYPHEALFVPEVAVLSASIMRWRIFGFVSECLKQEQYTILNSDSHPLHLLIKPLYDPTTNSVPENRLWQACDELSRVYVRYLTHRPEWLLAWAKGESLQSQVKKMMSDKARLDRIFETKQPEEEGDLPKWLEEHYLSLERLLGMLWHGLFAKTYLYRLSLEERFWQVLSGKRGEALANQAKQRLPEQLYLFTVQQIPQVELDFLKRLSLYLDVILLHFNPSMMFWADIVDKNWLQNQRIIKPNSVYLKDYGHGLLSRLGKESRETFAMLADMSGGADDEAWVIDWQDDFVHHYDQNPTLLNALKQDILMLGEGEVDSQEVMGEQMLKLLQNDEALTQKVRPKVGMSFDDFGQSLSIHACHSLKRQLELARLMIAKYLNESGNTRRTLSDVVVLLPDVSAVQELILSVFPKGQGVDGLTLPIKITGTTDKNIDELLYAIMGFYELLGEYSSRFYAEAVYEWLLTPALYESFGLQFHEMKRGCELLRQAGFRRGFDELHLSQTLDGDDFDYRYTFSYALDRLVLGLLAPTQGMPNHTLHPFKWQQGVLAEAVLPLEGVSLSDEKIINALTTIHQGLDENRHHYQRVDNVEILLKKIEDEVINRHFARFHDSIAMRAIFNAKNAMQASLRANQTQYDNKNGYKHRADPIRLSLKFVLNSLANDVKAQALSAEPAQVITFARFGALRSIPFGLTIMLDMNLSAFPRQDKAVRLDLMRAGVNRRGDRYNEDDDNGAFLDALLCTKDKVAIFYHGVSADGKNELLPASVVSELLQFFKMDALWRLDFDDITTDAHRIKKALPKLIEGYLVTHHEAHAFDREVFYRSLEPVAGEDELEVALLERLSALKHRQKQSLPVPMVWHLVRQVLDAKQERVPIVTLPTFDELVNMAYLLADVHAHAQTLWQMCCSGDSHHEHIRHLVGAVTKSAKTFLLQNLKFLSNDTSHLGDEPLSLDGLQAYTLKDLVQQVAKTGAFDGQYPLSLDGILRQSNDNTIINDGQISPMSLQSLHYGDLLPAGVSRLTIVDKHLQNFEEKMTQFVNLLGKISDSTLKAFLQGRLSGQTNYSQILTKTAERSVSFSLSNQHLKLTGQLPKQGERLWLEMVPSTARADKLMGFWMYHLLWQVSDEGQKTSIWHFDKADESIGFKGNLFILPPIDPDEAKIYLYQLIIVSQWIKRMPLVMTCREGLNYTKADEKKPFSLKSWLEVPFNGMIYDDNCHHEYWQFILKHHNPKESLMNAMPIAKLLFAPINQYLTSIE